MPRLAPVTPLRLGSLLLAALAGSASVLTGATTEKLQERTPQSIVDGVVNAMCQKQIVLLGEPPTHGEALAFDAKSRIVDGLVAKCGFNTVLFEMGVYDFIGFER